MTFSYFLKFLKVFTVQVSLPCLDSLPNVLALLLVKKKWDTQSTHYWYIGLPLALCNELTYCNLLKVLHFLRFFSDEVVFKNKIMTSTNNASLFSFSNLFLLISISHIWSKIFNYILKEQFPNLVPYLEEVFSVYHHLV